MSMIWGLGKPLHWREFEDFERLGSAPLYFYVGAGLSQGAGLVGWSEMARILWNYRAHYEGFDRDFPTDTPEGNARILDDFVNDSSTAALSHDNEDPRVFGRVALLNMLLRNRKPKSDWHKDGPNPRSDDKTDRARCGQPPLAEDLVPHSLIWRANCHGVVTPNYDMLLEHAHSLFHQSGALRSYRYNADFLRYIMSNPRFVLKLHGDINDLRTMLFDPQTAWAEGQQLADRYGQDLKDVYKTALESGHMVYVGMGFRDQTIRELHEFWRKRSESNYVRVALIREKDLPLIDGANVNAHFNPENYDDICFLTYQDDAESATEVVRAFLSCIVSERRHMTHERPPCQEAKDIHKQIFTEPTRRLGRTFRTDPWTCEGVPIDVK